MIKALTLRDKLTTPFICVDSESSIGEVTIQLRADTDSLILIQRDATPIGLIESESVIGFVGDQLAAITTLPLIEIIVISEDTELDIATDLLEQHQCDYLLLTHEGGKVSRVLSKQQLCSADEQREKQLAISNFVMDHITEATFLVAENGQIHDVNRAACESLSFSQEELLQLCVPDIDTEFTWERWQELWKKLKTEGSMTFESTHRSKHGETFPVEINTNFFLFNGSEYNCAVVRELSNRKAYEFALKDSEARFKAMIENSSEWIWAIDINGIHTYSNPVIEKILGYHPDEIIGTSSFSLLHEQDQAKVLERLPELINNQQGWDGWLLRWRHKDGSYRYMESNATPVYDLEQRLVGFQGADRDMTDRILAERDSARNTAEWNYAMDFFEDPIYLLGLDRKVIRANHAFYQFTHTTPDQVIGSHIAGIIHPDDEEELCPVCLAQEERRDAVITMEAHHPDNPAGAPIEVISRITRDELGEASSILMTIRDLSRARRTKEQLSQSQVVFESTSEGIMITDMRLQIVAVNPAFTTITGYTEQEAIGEKPSLLKSERHDEGFYHELWQAVESTGSWQGEVWNRRKSGEIYPEWLNISTVENEKGEIINYIGVFSDISQLKQSQSRLAFLAHHDPLTGLPNRLLFRARLDHAIDRADRDKRLVAVLFLDLDRFKHVNDSLGHTVGDALLEAVAKRFENLIRKEDTVARLGGDEFVILMEGLADPESAALLAEKISSALRDPFYIQEYELFVGVSIGISIYPQDGDGVEQLLMNADSAMYRAKEVGRSTYQFYTEELTTQAFEHLVLEGQLRRAIDDEQLLLHYQPQVEIESGRVLGFEALVRWEHPGQGLISPAHFIPLAEETNLIIPLGEWVLRRAAQQGREWLDSGLEFGTISVNISGPQIRLTDLRETVRTILEETGLPASRLELEITETFIMGHSKSAIEQLHSLRELGVSLAIDDFGTGYSSLAYLKQLPVDKLKIDRSFVRDLPNDENDVAISRAVIALGNSMRFTVIAEGVETEEQREFLLKEGCAQAQGFLFSKPLESFSVVSYLGLPSSK
ncbi:hypothetical protein BOW53_03635 [Solemya pervernicosa gill symbiont]|uniref:cyclic-guanylate-specific phosphodiesterase n=2 Tax=Gammaproteobacteria incertae sedis TaxID=118884 RepID=A0A1T2L967_9GAMM|nr:EAL domain-containing protein [Candidatus Reidiella endopervernicosa]OOZ41476.1 hypothetical protein BOW53_03635 [Solemya pervernicosa gill symbiont]QKQ27327.1 EAL domain-containing protein [Candidatus Reidiella endopervernicosa]